MNHSLPPSLRRFEMLLLDGKALKHVAKRLSTTRGTPGQLLGGKLLVAYRPRDGQVIDLTVNRDGEGNEAALVPELAGRLRDRPGKITLFVADRQFSSLKAFAEFAGVTSQFIVRHAKTLTFAADPERPAVMHDELSVRQIRRDEHRQLVALKELTSAVDVAAAVRPAGTVEELRTQSTRLLNGVWRKEWVKTRNKTARKHAAKAKGNGAHTSVVRRQQAARPAPAPLPIM